MLLLWIYLASILARFSCQQSDFLSLSCGASKAFKDSTTGIDWQPDSNYTFNNAGEAGSTSDGKTLRFFSLIHSTRNLNCFDIIRNPGLHLARATFTYKNYDKLSKPPSFQFIVNQTVVSTINLNSQDPVVEEVIVPGGGTTSFCLLATTGDVPVISSLELRPLSGTSSYEVAAGITTGKVFLHKHYRINCGETSRTIRFPNDPQDRIWDLDSNFSPQTNTSSFNGSINSTSSTTAPEAVLQTSRVAPAGTLSYVFTVPDVKLAQGSPTYLIVASFATLTNSTLNVTFDILLNEAVKQQGFILPGAFTGVSFAFTGSPTSVSTLNITFSSQSSSPEVNAMEVYRIVDAAPPTTSTDATALYSIAATYTLKFWDHDPCLPVPWFEIQCSDALQVTSLDLSKKGLTGSLLPYVGDLSELTNLNLSRNQLSGPIPEELWELSALETLDLSFNQLSGKLPTEFHSMDNLKIMNLKNNSLSGGLDSLTALPSITSINIENNNFSGQIPGNLQGRISSSGNICLGRNSSECFQTVPPSPSPTSGFQLNDTRSKSQTGKVVGIALGCSAAALLLLLGLLLFLFRRRRRHNDTIVTKRITTDARDWNNCKEFSFKELSIATNGFRNELGKGSFGPVYHGRLQNGQEVAIKVRSDASQLGADAFINEVALLSRVRHQNLVHLLGFCQKAKKQLLVYEFMAGGTLMDHLYGSKSPLDWKARLKIAVGAAAGLDYLHNGSEPKIIHRDIKSTNILLDSALTAKVADFGLSKHIASSDATHVTTLVKGTAGYLDPEYYASNQLTEKSDVYSFGVVLLEIICGREVLSDRVPADEYSIINWGRPKLQAGLYNEVADRNILGRFSVGSMAIVGDCACKSVSRNPDERPKMNEVLRRLREALALETAG